MGIPGLGNNNFYDTLGNANNRAVGDDKNSESSFADALDKAKTPIKATDLINKLEESKKLTSKGLKEETDWRDMSDDEWDKLIEDIDEYIEDFRDRLEEMKEKQDEAAQKAAAQADPEMKTIAASEAALKVATNGFSGMTDTDADDAEDVPSENGEKREKNWTKILDTDDQEILSTAKRAQDMERMAIKKSSQIASGELSYSDSVELSRYKDKKKGEI